MILYKECTITKNGQDFYHDTGWQKVNITVCYLKSKWPDWGDFCIKCKFCNDWDALLLHCCIFYDSKNRIYAV